MHNVRLPPPKRMRKVIVLTDKLNEELKKYEKVPDGKGHGYFHCFNSDYIRAGDLVDGGVVAIIEREDGTVSAQQLEYIKFVNNPDGTTKEPYNEPTL